MWVSPITTYEGELVAKLSQRVTRKRTLQVLSLIGGLAFILIVGWSIWADMSSPPTPVSEPFADTLTAEEVHNWCTGCNQGQFSVKGKYVLYQSPAHEDIHLQIPQGHRKTVVMMVFFSGEAPSGVKVKPEGYYIRCVSGETDVPTQVKDAVDPRIRSLTFTRRIYFTIVDLNPRTRECAQADLPE